MIVHVYEHVVTKEDVTVRGGQASIQCLEARGYICCNLFCTNYLNYITSKCMNGQRMISKIFQECIVTCQNNECFKMSYQMILLTQNISLQLLSSWPLLEQH